MKIEEQEKVLLNDKKNMLVSASAGSGKTYIMIKYISKLICEDKIPVKDFLVLTFTKAAATEMKERLQKSLKENGADEFVVDQIDSLSVSNISTIHSFCEKYIKKYANLLGLNENFQIADENLMQKIRQNAFSNALKEFQENFTQEYFELISSFKNDKTKIKDIVFEIETLVNSISDKEGFLKENIENSQSFFEKATDFLVNTYKNRLKENLIEIEKLHVDDFQHLMEKLLCPFLESKDILQLCKIACEFNFPYLPKRKDVGDEVVDRLSVIKENINKIIGNLKELNLQTTENFEAQKTAKIEKMLLKLFELYEKAENSIKKAENFLDFYDLEKYMKILSKQENLFAGIKYVFVDEYQDTNKVQERIVKNIAKNSNFVAVGDVKQGIYGFRLASSEIFLKDLNDFEKDENSSVLFLKSNFRSSQKILDFVNSIFKVCMTLKTANVDYEETSMLSGKKEFKDDGEKTINIDIIKQEELAEDPLPEVYSVKEAVLFQENYNLGQLTDIKRRINEIMSSQIYDGENFRKCRYSDIAILSRKRDSLFSQLEDFLQENDIPVISNSRNILMEETEIKVLVNFLKVVQNPDDDIAMLSVLMSGLSNISLDEIIEEKSIEEKSLCEIVLTDKNEKFEAFNKNLQDFRFDVEIFGAKKAFLNLFNKTNYRAYVNSKINHQKLNTFIDKFLSAISASGYEYDLSGLINYFESVEITVVSESSIVDDAVLLTTIHNSKGLEYPIVFLVGCDQNLKKSRPKVDVEINEEFGLAVKFYDKENNNEIMTARMRAIKEHKAQKEFVEELMIFYVALTRAKNRLYLFGNYKENLFEKYSVEECDSYFDLVFFALKDIGEKLKAEDIWQDENMSIRIFDKIEEKVVGHSQNLENAEIDEKIAKIIENYIGFKYQFNDELNFRLKESVTSLTSKNDEDLLGKYSNDNIKLSNSSIDIGNAYHLALKTLDFDKISTIEELKAQVSLNPQVFEQITSLLDMNLLLKNVLTLKRFTDGAIVYKEKEFMMKDKLCNLLEDTPFEDEILVQGIIDLFVIKDDKIVLIDYKYSNSNSEDYLIKRYKNQLKLYKKSIKNAFNLQIEGVYLLSLKNNKLIEVQI